MALSLGKAGQVSETVSGDLDPGAGEEKPPPDFVVNLEKLFLGFGTLSLLRSYRSQAAQAAVTSF